MWSSHDGFSVSAALCAGLYLKAMAIVIHATDTLRVLFQTVYIKSRGVTPQRVFLS